METKRKINIPIFVSHQGCPNDCVFCNQRQITGISVKEEPDEIRRKISTYLNSAELNADIEIAFFGGSFTGIPLEEQNLYLNIANEFKDKISGIRLSTRPDYIDEGVLNNLKEKNVTTIELGVQSMIDSVLEKNKRGHIAEDSKNAVKLIRKFGFKLGLQMMVGMYGSNEEYDLKTAEEIILLKPDFVRIYPTVVIKDTELYNLYESNKYLPYELDKAVEICAEILVMFRYADIPVIRLGLMAGEDINEKKVIGPYHSSFRELVESKIYLDRIIYELEYKNGYNKDIIIITNTKNTSKIIGNKRKNLKILQDKFNIKGIKIEQDNNIKEYKIIIL